MVFVFELCFHSAVRVVFKNVNKIVTASGVKFCAADNIAVFIEILHKPAAVSIVSALRAVGAQHSFAYRFEIAEVNGVVNYSGTAKQNGEMLSLLKKGVLKKP